MRASAVYAYMQLTNLIRCWTPAIHAHVHVEIAWMRSARPDNSSTVPWLYHSYVHTCKWEVPDRTHLTTAIYFGGCVCVCIDIYTYKRRWEVPDRAGPGPEDGSTVPWLYHSHVNEGMDVSSGLIGLILVCSDKCVNVCCV